MNGVSAGSSHDLLERQDLLRRIDHLLDALIRGESRVVVIEGGLGAGKSALLREIGDTARARAATLVARCAPEEADEERGVLRQLRQDWTAPMTTTSTCAWPGGIGW